MKTLNGFEFVSMQETALQEIIRTALTTALEASGYEGAELLELVQDGMDSKGYDLTDTINFEEIGVELV